jgi:hypothetical protein
MNGRVYDPVLGRFMSADPYVDSVADSQSLNRYSYVSNNPLGYTDPSGYFKLKEILPAIIGIVVAAVAIVTHQWYILKSTASFFSALGTGLKGASAIYGAAAGGFSSGFSGSLLNGGSIGDAFKAGVIGAAVGAATAWAAGQIGGFFDDLGGAWADGSLGNWSGRTVSHALVGGLASEAQGGQFRHGFYSSAASTGIMHINGVGGFMGGDKGGAWIAARTAMAATIGGTASALAGGKFANGAVTSAFQHLFNAEAVKAQKVAVILVEGELAAEGERKFWEEETRRLRRLGRIIVDEYSSLAELETRLSTYKEHRDQILLVTSHGSIRVTDFDFGLKVGGRHVQRASVENLILSVPWETNRFTIDYCSPYNLNQSNYAKSANQVREYFDSRMRWMPKGGGRWELKNSK